MTEDNQKMTTQTKTTENQKILPPGWRKVKLGEVLSVSGGGTPSTQKQEYWNGDIPWLTPAEVSGFSGRYIEKTERNISRAGLQHSSAKLMPAGSILFTSRATIGDAVINKIPMATNQGFINIPPSEKVDQLFLFYWLKRNYGYLNQIAVGSTFPELIKSVFKEVEIEIPDITDQKRIANILSAFDDKIELNNKISRTLEQMAQAIFKEWFVKNQKSKIKSQKLNDLVQIISGHPFSSKLYTQDKKALGVVTIKNVQDGNFITACDSFITEKNVPKNMSRECRISDGDILLSLTGNVGRICFVYGGKYLLNQRVAKLRPKNETDRAFCYFLFRQPVLQNQLINMAKGSAQPNLSPVETGEIVVAIPPRDILDKLSDKLGSLYGRLLQNAVENQKLAALRDLLLPKLMNGEIKV